MAIVLVAFAAYYYALPKYRAYRLRRQPNQADALKGGESDD